MLLLTLSVATALLGSSVAQNPPEVEISSGRVLGRRIPTHYDTPEGDPVRVNSFYGIPFGKAPVGELRFADPEPAEPWGDNAFEAFRLGTQPVQNPRGWLWLTHPGWRNYGEDCLNVNVFTPENMDPETPYPVMVWFYGGGYQSGGNIQYPGHFLAARDVVVVVPNYRVNMFGFMTTSDDVAPGNYGLKDQVLALQWVQENIAAFGGDPGKVTLFGQSAGAASSSLHMVIPESEGLFHQVIAQSGTEGSFWTFNYPNSDPADYFRQNAEEVECPTDDTQAMVECMRGFEDPYFLYNNSAIECTPGHFCMGHQPVIDGTFVPDYPYLLRERGEFAKDTKIMSGYNSEDGSLYTVFMIPESLDGGFNRSRWQYHLRESLLYHWEPQFSPKQADDLYEAFDWFYTPWPVLEDEELNRQVFNDLITDGAFGYPADRQVRRQSETSSGNYLYLFGYRSNATLEGQGFWNGTEWVGVPHSGELPYVFGWALMQLAPRVRTDSRILIDIMDYNEEDIAYAEYINDLWTNFAKYGNPTPDEAPVDAPLGNGQVDWPEFTDDERNILIIKRTVEAEVNYRAKENAFYLEYCSYLTQKPLLQDGVAQTKTSPVRRFDPSIFEEQTELMVESLLLEQMGDEYWDL